MNHSNIHIVGLALSTLANIGSSEMSRDLCSEVERLLADAHAYVRKKAALAAIRLIRKVPELHENFVQKVKAVLNERTHAVLLTGLTLIHEICMVNPETIGQFRKVSLLFVPPTFVSLLNSLFSTFVSPFSSSSFTSPSF